MSSLLIQPEDSSDGPAIRRLLVAAFGGCQEADLVEALRESGKVRLSLTARLQDVVVGHILFTQVETVEKPSIGTGWGLAPMAVAPPRQRRGIGGALIAEGLKQGRALGCEWMVVLGHPEYYPRFGFRPASGYGLTCEYDVPDEVFMAMELRSGALESLRGQVRYQPEFKTDF